MKTPVIVFDIGNVLVSFSLEPFHEFFAKHAREAVDAITVSEVTEIARRYELGLLSCEEFTSAIAVYFQQSPGHHEIAKAWCGIFRAEKTMLELAKFLSQNHQIAILSNTNELHWQHLDSLFDISSFANVIILSHRVAALKPDQRIYAAMQEKLGADPKNILFIDDKLENVTAANELGWTAFQHCGTKETITKLNSLGIEA